MSGHIPVPERVKSGSENLIQSMDDWQRIHAHSIAEPDDFWLNITRKSIVWDIEPTIGLEGGFDTIEQESLKWFSDGRLNATVSCVDQHLKSRPDKVAILWEGDEPGVVRRITYRQLHTQVCRFSNALQSRGITSGDRVIIYMGMVPEAAIAMLACARIGAIHSVVFGGFSADSVADRIIDSGSKVIITMDEGKRAGRTIPLKKTTDEAIAIAGGIDTVIVYQHTANPVEWNDERDLWWHEIIENESSEHEAVILEAEHPLFILYTSGSTGKPKGQVHSHGGYITYTAFTHRTVFDLREDDVFACVADVGWITGHSYIVYGPLANGATTFMFESTPLYPDAGRYWDMVERHGFTIFYTAPTAIRALAAKGDGYVHKYDRSSLRVLGTVGEPINPEAWEWYHRVVGEEKCTIVDTWWQTETGGICISPIAPATPVIGGSATLPLPGIQPELYNAEGELLKGKAEGLLCLSQSWPGQTRTIYGDHHRYVQTYFSTIKNRYFTGDGCRRDEYGYYWITGRVDDVINVSGHRMGTAEFEAILVENEMIAEAGVVGFPHDIKGQGVRAFLVLAKEVSDEESLYISLNQLCRNRIGAHAKIDRFCIIPALPKTRSGKVMRRILRKVAEGEPEKMGDISTLADPDVVEAIIDSNCHYV
jgi:acetyl-CoA synthetase